MSFTDFVDLLARELHHHEASMLTANGTVCTCGGAHHRHRPPPSRQHRRRARERRRRRPLRDAARCRSLRSSRDRIAFVFGEPDRMSRRVLGVSARDDCSTSGHQPFDVGSVWSSAGQTRLMYGGAERVPARRRRRGWRASGWLVCRPDSAVGAAVLVRDRVELSTSPTPAGQSAAAQPTASTT